MTDHFKFIEELKEKFKIDTTELNKNYNSQLNDINILINNLNDLMNKLKIQSNILIKNSEKIIKSFQKDFQKK